MENDSKIDDGFVWQHVLYRLFDSSNELLYVGITKDANARFRQHAAAQQWWGEVADCRTEFLPSRADLERVERDAIRAERPRYNKTHAVQRAPKVAAVKKCRKEPQAPVKPEAKAVTSERVYRRSPVNPEYLITPQGDVVTRPDAQGWRKFICANPIHFSGCPRNHPECGPVADHTRLDLHWCRILDPEPTHLPNHRNALAIEG